MGKVYGRVTYQGKPVTKGTVSFQASDPDGRNATGQIDADGNYTLQTEEPGDGAQVGGYFVTISARDEPILDYIPKTPPKPVYLVPAKFEDPKTSGLMRSVTKGSNSINLELTD